MLQGKITRRFRAIYLAPLLAGRRFELEPPPARRIMRPDAMINSKKTQKKYFVRSQRAHSVLRLCVVLSVVGIVLCLAGCRAPAEPRITGTETRLTAPVGYRMVVGRSVENRPIETVVFGTGSDVVLVVATIHGNEPAGTALVEYLSDHLSQDRSLLERRRIVMVPVANPDGMVRNSRFNARGVDLNRNFAAGNRLNSKRNGLTALSEPEARVISRLITRYRPNRIVAIHQPLSCIDYDGPAKTLAERMARYCDLPVRKVGALPGSLGSFAGETLNIPIVTMELRKNDDELTTQQLWDRYGRALLAAIAFPGTIERFSISEK